MLSKILKQLILSSMLFLIVISSCTQATITENGNLHRTLLQETTPIANPVGVSVDGCIPPLETFAYSTIPDDSKPRYPGAGPIILPPFPWQQMETSMETWAEVTRIPSILATRFVNGNTELWFAPRLYDYYLPETDSELYQFIIYRPDIKTWNSISAEVEGSGVFVNKLFVARDGSLWGQNVWNMHSKVTGFPVLSKYNEKTERFEFEQSTQLIPAARTDAKDSLPYWSEVLLDSQGIFWVFVHKDAIYSYNSVTQEIGRHVEIPDILVADPRLAPDGSMYYINLYYIGHKPTHTIQDKEIFHFAPQTGKTEKVPIQLEPWPPASDILVDHAGNLWLGSLGWREPNGTWYQVHRSPVFITNVLWSGMEYRWKTPEIVMESSDGRLWFRSDNGMTWLDPRKGEWCWYTTEQSNIVEDQEGNLWMIADNKLYRYELEP
ncbi:MAG: hypothetical protein GY796_08210 [Chloroflexi bacterium]|nr:hypothetical protein [Chloroflexota bacterium]